MLVHRWLIKLDFPNARDAVLCLVDNQPYTLRLDGRKGCRPCGVCVGFDVDFRILPFFTVVPLQREILDGSDDVTARAVAGNNPRCADGYLLFPDEFDRVRQRRSIDPTTTVVFDFAVSIIQQQISPDALVGFIRDCNAGCSGQVLTGRYQPPWPAQRDRLTGSGASRIRRGTFASAMRHQISQVGEMILVNTARIRVVSFAKTSGHADDLSLTTARAHDANGAERVVVNADTSPGHQQIGNVTGIEGAKRNPERATFLVRRELSEVSIGEKCIALEALVEFGIGVMDVIGPARGNTAHK